MSGYNPETGIYQLTATKAHYWSGRDKPMSYYAAWLKNKGLEVTLVRSAYLAVKANEAEVKAALLSPERAKSEAMWQQPN
ncbi:hypothetical protein [Nostoc sp. WHI]|uniref:hypothetical protein n=1 Tax=Nostoc sp. WHI TaxID=2650611 RepID=UPI0018C80CD3|nr:hypothetical protein [Nostoc sp. WHI]MBG1266958.1 hypothetical protein [Nostoc sp. WHI]